MILAKLYPLYIYGEHCRVLYNTTVFMPGVIPAKLYLLFMEDIVEYKTTVPLPGV